MKLTDKKIAQALRVPFKRHQKYRALADGKRLFLRITPEGSTIWRLKYVIGGRGGKESQTSLGAYPEVSIETARELAEEVREQAKLGRNPAKEKREAKEAVQDRAAVTFGRVGLEWLSHDDTLAARTKAKHAWLLEKLRKLHPTPIAEVKRSDVRTVLQAIEKVDDRRETAHRAGQVASKIFIYAMDHYEDIVKANPAAERKSWLKPKRSKRPTGHLPGITDPAKLGTLLKMIDMFDETVSRPTVINALRFLARVFVRQEALCGAQWSEMHDLDDPRSAEWRIPAARMKGPIGQRRPFVVPLSRQAIEILEAQRHAVGDSRYVFPHAVREGRGMSSGALKAALAALSYSPSEHTPHGFRTTAATLLREPPLKYDSDLLIFPPIGHFQTREMRLLLPN